MKEPNVGEISYIEKNFINSDIGNLNIICKYDTMIYIYIYILFLTSKNYSFLCFLIFMINIQ